MSQVFVSWSGGKDCCLAAYRATVSGLGVRYLANTVTGDGQRSRSHGLLAEVLQVQSQAIGIPLAQRRISEGGYEGAFKSLLRGFKAEGINGGVFGDIDFNEHRLWIDRVCQEEEITPYYPLWEEDQDKIMRNFIDLGFEAVVVATKADLLGEEWLGRKVDLDFIKELENLEETKKITLCGEAGEYHTLVTDGPLFKKRIEVMEANTILKSEHWFLNIARSQLRDKR